MVCYTERLARRELDEAERELQVFETLSVESEHWSPEHLRLIRKYEQAKDNWNALRD